MLRDAGLVLEGCPSLSDVEAKGLIENLAKDSPNGKLLLKMVSSLYQEWHKQIVVEKHSVDKASTQTHMCLAVLKSIPCVRSPTSGESQEDLEVIDDWVVKAAIKGLAYERGYTGLEHEKRTVIKIINNKTIRHIGRKQMAKKPFPPKGKPKPADMDDRKGGKGKGKGGKKGC
jgi:hypothetical protein